MPEYYATTMGVFLGPRGNTAGKSNRDELLPRCHVRTKMYQIWVWITHLLPKLHKSAGSLEIWAYGDREHVPWCQLMKICSVKWTNVDVPYTTEIYILLLGNWTILTNCKSNLLVVMTLGKIISSPLLINLILCRCILGFLNFQDCYLWIPQSVNYF